MRSFTVNEVGPFSLRAAIEFLAGFDPSGFAAAPGHLLELAFATDRDWHPVGVRLEERGHAVNGQFWGEGEAEHVRSQVQRILSLDQDATGFAELGRAEPVVGGLQARFPGLRPVRFWSPYEAACWAVMSQGITPAETSALKTQIAAELGPQITIDHDSLSAFPPPQQLATLAEFPGLSEQKVAQLRGVAERALAGDLDAFLLRDMSQQQALAGLKQIPGIDDFAAELILIHGAGDPDYVPAHDPGLTFAVVQVYELPGLPTQDELDRITDSWRPFRSWVAFLLRRAVATDASRGEVP